MRAVSGELEDKVVFDGAKRLGFFWKILLPLSVPTLATIATFQTQYSQDTARILAFTSVSMIPALGFFAFAERRIVGGLSGSVKG